MEGLVGDEEDVGGAYGWDFVVSRSSVDKGGNVPVFSLRRMVGQAV